ncbi:glycosyltransferase [Psychrobacillus sp. NEAU-3TGS]|uniref:glycosyltransferase n=1 Tax=Psychrobacillus sp. NEAU-3TGS TaxID=2995412 RepID=UPI002498C1F0|nr:glycosyltransferase [Psychrobacillus sp. NEAU-3TGS]MDI2587665.1 glycosyltransferase [Psychrobacillus sp. NEAU-3TGS]
MEIKMILTNGFDPDPRVYKEAKALLGNGYDVEILCWDRDNRYIDKQSEQYDGIKITRFFPKSAYGSGYKQLYSYWQFITQIKRYLKKHTYDVIHAHDIDGVIIGLFVKKTAKLVWDMHEFYDGFNSSGIRKFFLEKIAKECFRKSDGIIYVSDSQKERYEVKKVRNTPDVIVMNAPEGVLFNGFRRTSSDKLRISFIGSLREFDTLKKLMDIGEKYKDITINLNGAGVAYKELKALQPLYRNTNITGKFHYKDIKKYYENTDIIFAVYDSKLINVKYAFPVKGLEAIASGTPIITNKNTSFGDFVSINDIGFTVDEYNELELEELIKKISDNKELLKIKSENLTKIKEKFKWDEHSNNLIKFYQKLIEI